MVCYCILDRRYKHPNVDSGNFLKRVFVLIRSGNDRPSLGLVSYQWLCEPHYISPSCHGNAKSAAKKSEGFFPTKKSVLLALKEQNRSMPPARARHATSEKAGGILLALGPGDLPRDSKQAQNVAYRSPYADRSDPRGPKAPIDVELIRRMQLSGNFVRDVSTSHRSMQKRAVRVFMGMLICLFYCIFFH